MENAHALLADERHAAGINALPVPLGRSAPADEIAKAVVFLLRPETSYVHGQVLYVDGGSDVGSRSLIRSLCGTTTRRTSRVAMSDRTTFCFDRLALRPVRSFTH